jgi:hypothetical protein
MYWAGPGEAYPGYRMVVVELSLSKSSLGPKGERDARGGRSESEREEEKEELVKFGH